MCNNADVITVIVERLTAFSLRFRLSWLKAHQNEKNNYQELDMAARMKCDADELAISFRMRTEDG